MVPGEARKHLDIERIAQIKKAARILLTLHDGSGTDDNDLRNAIAAGINIVHINTELRVAWRRGLENGLAKHRRCCSIHMLPAAFDSVNRVVLSLLTLFNSEQKLGKGLWRRPPDQKERASAPSRW